MDKHAEQLREYRLWARQELERCVDFWLKNGMDKEHGGVYTCLDRTGKLFSTDKSVWFQGRCAWTFAHLCSQYGPRNLRLCHHLWSVHGAADWPTVEPGGGGGEAVFG